MAITRKNRSEAQLRRLARLRTTLGGGLAVLLGASLSGAAVPALSVASAANAVETSVVADAVLAGATATVTPAGSASTVRASIGAMPVKAADGDLPTAHYTPQDYTVASEPAFPTACVPSTTGTSSSTQAIPDREFWVLLGDTMEFKAAMSMCPQISVLWSGDPDTIRYSPPNRLVTWEDPDGDTTGVVTAVGAECEATGNRGCFDPPLITSLYRVTATDAFTQSGSYNYMTTRPVQPPTPAPSGVNIAQSASSSGGQMMRVADPQLKLAKELCINSGVAGQDGTGPGDGCDPDNDALWVPSQLVAQDSTVTWRLTVTNTGNVDLKDVQLTTETSSPASNTDSCLAVFESVDLEAGVTFASDYGAWMDMPFDWNNPSWSEGPNAEGEWQGGETARHVCTTEVGKTELTNSAHVNATFDQVDLNGNPLVDRFTDPMDGDAHRLGSKVEGATVRTVAPEMELDKLVCETGTGCDPYDVDPGVWLKATTVDSGTAADWTLVVTNTGNVPLKEVKLDSDSLTNGNAFNLSSCLVGAEFPLEDELLAVGESTSISCSTQNVTNTKPALPLINTAQAWAKPDVTNPDDPEQPFDTELLEGFLSNKSSATVLAEVNAEISLEKSADVSTVEHVGDEIEYSFLVTNTGEVPLSNITVADDAAQFTGTGSLSAISCPATTLEPTDSFTCTATYTVTQADIDAGEILNVATVSGDDEDDNTVTSPESDATVTATPAAELTIEKTADHTTVANVGDAIAYSFVVKNTGNVTLTDIAVVDKDEDFTGSGSLSAVTCPVTTLAPEAETTCTATYTVTQADIDQGDIFNSAYATGTTPSDDPVESDSDDVTVTATPDPALTIVKSADATTVSAAGTEIEYSFLVKNTGNVTLSDVGVTDEDEAFTGSGSLSAVTCLATTLAPEASTTCTATYTTTQQDINRGSIYNSAHATGTTPTDDSVESDSDNVTITAPSAPALSIVKTADVTAVAVVGDQIDYTFRVTNTGNVTLTNLSVTDDDEAFTGSGSLPAVSCPVTSLAPGNFTLCTASYTVTQLDLDSGEIFNSAYATGTPPTGDPVDSPADDATVTATQSPALTIVKSANRSTVAAVGDPIIYSFLITNTGNVTLLDIAVIDEDEDFTGSGSISAISCPVSFLVPGASTTCTATYQATQADLNRGSIYNSAHATGEAPDGDTVTSAPDDVSITATQTPALSIVKSADTLRVGAAGDMVTYSFLVTNTGNVSLTDLSVTDEASEFTGSGTISAVSCPVTTLAPEAETTCTATYTVTEDDIDAGEFYNSAHATGTPPAGIPFDSPSDNVTVVVALGPAIAVEKTSDVQTVSKPGDVVTYSFLVTNVGDEPLSNVTVTDDAEKFTGSGSLSAIDCPATTLAAEASFTCTATYTVTQDDIDAGSILNVATAAAESPEGDPVESPESQRTITAPAAPAITLEKTANRNMYNAAGIEVEYSFLVTNTGNVTLSEVTVDETSFSGSGTLSAVTCPTTTLAPGASVTCSATYTTLQGDVDRGSLVNEAIAVGTAPAAGAGAGAEVESDPSDATLTAPRAPSASLVKVAYTDELELGDTVEYGFRVTNTGNVTLENVSIDETNFSGNPAFLSAISCPTTTLLPGATVECTASYVVQQADVDENLLENAATASADPVGTSPEPPVSTNESDVSLPSDPRPELLLEKTADVSEVLAVGDEIVYTFTVTNTGNVGIHDVDVTETAFSGDPDGLTALDCPVNRVLAPLASLSCTATYTVTQADIDAGSIENAAVADGLTTKDVPVESSESDVSVPAVVEPAITLAKTVDKTTVSKAGDGVTYSFLVTNTGNATLTELKVVDDASQFTGAGTLSAVSCPETQLAPGESTTCTATYTMTQADIDAGSVLNVATANGRTLAGTPVSVESLESEATVKAEKTPALELVKTSDKTVIRAVGEIVTYSFAVTNTGNVTMRNIGVVDDAAQFTGTGSLSAVECPVTPLAPGETVTCTATYRVTQADLAAGSLFNAATATGVPQAGPGQDPAVVESTPSDVTALADPEAGIVVISKKLDGIAAGNSEVEAKVFQIDVTCQVPADDGGPGATVWSGTLDLKGGQEKLLVDEAGTPVVLPGGERCFAAEPNSGGADATVIEHDSWDTGLVVAGGTVDSPERLSLTVTNRFGPTGLAVTGYAATAVLVLALVVGGAGFLLMVARRRREAEAS